MNIIFDLKLNFRGTTTATLDYAYYNEIILGNKSIISYEKSELYDDIDRDPYKLVEQLKEDFDVIEYTNRDDTDLGLQYDKHNAKAIYWIKAGFQNECFLPGKTNLIHSVFNHYDPHGDKYFYVSKWLGLINNIDYVPHIVDLPKTKVSDLRKKLGLENDFVIGRHGGFEEFHIPFVNDCVIKLADEGVKFLFLNTKKFTNHKNIIYLDHIIDKQDKTDYILSCDLMLQARARGETFGLSICESLFHNIPVLAYGGGYDRHNNMLLDDIGLSYTCIDELYYKIKFLMNKKVNVSHIVDEFSPERVMEKFDILFLGGLR